MTPSVRRPVYAATSSSFCSARNLGVFRDRRRWHKVLQSPGLGLHSQPFSSTGPGGTDATEAPEKVGPEAAAVVGLLLLCTGGVWPALISCPASSVPEAPCVLVVDLVDNGKLPGPTRFLSGPLRANMNPPRGSAEG